MFRNVVSALLMAALIVDASALYYSCVVVGGNKLFVDNFEVGVLSQQQQAEKDAYTKAVEDYLKTVSKYDGEEDVPYPELPSSPSFCKNAENVSMVYVGDCKILGDKLYLGGVVVKELDESEKATLKKYQDSVVAFNGKLTAFNQKYSVDFGKDSEPFSMEDHALLNAPNSSAGAEYDALMKEKPEVPKELMLCESF